MTTITIPSYVSTAKELAEWLRTAGGTLPLEQFGEELADALEHREWYDEIGHREWYEDLYTHIETAFRALELDQEQKDDPLWYMIDEMVNRLKAVRNALHEYHDIDISNPGYESEFDLFVRKAGEDDDLRYRVRRGLSKMGLLTDQDSNIYAAQMLTALLGVEFGT